MRCLWRHLFSSASLSANTSSYRETKTALKQKDYRTMQDRETSVKPWSLIQLKTMWSQISLSQKCNPQRDGDQIRSAVRRRSSSTPRQQETVAIHGVDGKPPGKPQTDNNPTVVLPWKILSSAVYLHRHWRRFHFYSESLNQRNHRETDFLSLLVFHSFGNTIL